MNTDLYHEQMATMGYLSMRTAVNKGALWSPAGGAPVASYAKTTTEGKVDYKTVVAKRKSDSRWVHLYHMDDLSFATPMECAVYLELSK